MSLLNFQQLHQQIKDKLFEISYKVSCYNKSGDLDISRYAESYFRLLLNVIFEKKGWFFEKATKINQDTYDLYDKKNKVCIQVTSNSRSTKKTDTIKSFEKKQLQNGFENLIILFLSDTKPKTESNRQNNYQYEDYSIVDLSGLIESTCTQKQLFEIRDILFEKLNVASLTSPKTTPSPKTVVSQKEFLRRQKIEKELKEELVYPEYWKIIDLELLSKEPFRKFKDSRFILRSISDETYPNGGENVARSRTFMYDFYERGILIDLSACITYYAAINSLEEWYVLEYEEKDNELPEGFTKSEVLVLAKLPYKNIISFNDGDDYYNDYHLFCKYAGINNSPFDEIIYRYPNKLGYYWDDLDQSKKIER
jgi:hypothetical protein